MLNDFKDRQGNLFTHVLYHGNCPDGMTASWVAWTFLKDSEIKYIPVGYGKEPPELPKDALVLIVDFSYPRDVLLKIKENVGKLVVLDHHKTAEEALRGLDFCRFDLLKSGAMLCWEYFYPDVNFSDIPPLVTYAQDRDLWLWKLPHSREFSAAVWSYDKTNESWDAINKMKFNDIINQGTAILRYSKQLVEQMVSHAIVRDIEFDGKVVRMPDVNATVLQSEVCERLMELYPEYPAAATYRRNRDDITTYSLRSKGDFDVSALAKTKGGGGHKNAAGFAEKL